MYFEKNIINLIFSFDPTYKELYDLVMQDILKLEPGVIYYGTPCMYRIKNTKPFFGEVKIFKNIYMKPIWNSSYYILDYSKC